MLSVRYERDESDDARQAPLFLVKFLCNSHSTHSLRTRELSQLPSELRTRAVKSLYGVTLTIENIEHILITIDCVRVWGVGACRCWKQKKKRFVTSWVMFASGLKSARSSLNSMFFKVKGPEIQRIRSKSIEVKRSTHFELRKEHWKEDQNFIIRKKQVVARDYAVQCTSFAESAFPCGAFVRHLGTPTDSQELPELAETFLVVRASTDSACWVHRVFLFHFVRRIFLVLSRVAPAPFLPVTRRRCKTLLSVLVGQSTSVCPGRSVKS